MNPSSGRDTSFVSRRTLLALGGAVVVGACTGRSGSERDSTASGTSAPATPPPDTASGPVETPNTEPPDTTEYAPLPEPPLDGAVEYDGKRTPFTLGVASGDPTPHRVVIWTRLAPKPLDANGGMDDRSYRVTWEVALDESFEETVFTGVARADAAHAHSIHVDLSELEPAVEFFYRFRAGSHVSAVGRTQSMPLLTMPDSITIGTACCQNYEAGYFAAHRDAAQSRLDLMVFLGDYIYESSTQRSRRTARRHGMPDATDLTGYRARYALYKSDPDLQAAHASCPWIVTWSDHEVSDNYAGLEDNGGPATREEFQRRRDAAYKAWWEHMPVRLAPPVPGQDFPIYRQFSVGSLVEVSLLDCRQYRSDQACTHQSSTHQSPCNEVSDASRTMLGEAQEQWVGRAIGSSNTTWSVLASDTIMMNTTHDRLIDNYDQWDGYPAARQRLVQVLEDSKAKNLVVLSGDSHLSAAGNLVTGGTARVALAAEFVTPSVSSDAGAKADDLLAAFRSGALPDVLDVEIKRRGWVRHTITPDRWTAEYRLVDRPTRQKATVSTWSRFAIKAGSPGAQEVATSDT